MLLAPDLVLLSPEVSQKNRPGIVFQRDSLFRICSFSIAFQGSKRVMDSYSWLGFRRSREDLYWSINVLHARSFWAGFDVEIGDCNRMPLGQCRFLDSCLSWNPHMSMRRLGKKDEEEKDILMKKNEHLQERVYMYEGYWKKYKLQAPKGSRCYEFSSLTHDVEIIH